MQWIGYAEKLQSTGEFCVMNISSKSKKVSENRYAQSTTQHYNETGLRTWRAVAPFTNMV